MSRKAIDSAIEIAKQNDLKLYIAYVIDPKGYSITHSQNMEMEKANKVRLISEVKDATAYVKDKGKTAKIETKSIILEGSPAENVVRHSNVPVIVVRG